jgi:hypothetical protein
MISSIRCAPVIRQGEAKSRAAIDNTFRPDFPSMALDNAARLPARYPCREIRFGRADANGVNKLAARAISKPAPSSRTK